MGSSFGALLVAALAVLGFVLNWGVLCNGGKTSSFLRTLNYSLDMPLHSDVFQVPNGFNPPQQVHITQGDHIGTAMIISWVTQEEPGENTVVYWTDQAADKPQRSAPAVVTQYKYYNYTSGYIHHANLTHLQYNTTYYYRLGTGNSSRTFQFTTHPPLGLDVPYTFGIIGDLGQTFSSNTTLSHYEQNPLKGKTVLYVGDLSYADVYPFHDNVRWDTWCRFVERSAAFQPWIWAAGNHEVDFAPELGETEIFVPYLHRFYTPNKASGSTSPFWYSIKRASAYIIVLAPYSAFGYSTLQLYWFEQELPKVNRSETPWLIIIMHSPFYNSYYSHYMEGETTRVVYENLFVRYKVDAVFAGHVHAYERSERVSNVRYNITNGICTPVFDMSAPVYITVGDGGNLEGLYLGMTEPQPSYSAFREASYGHGILDIKNRTHAFFGWNRNQDSYAVKADSVWLFNRFWFPLNDSTAKYI